MGHAEIAMQIVIKALETRDFALSSPNSGDDEELEKVNAFNAKQISKFYTEIYKGVRACRFLDE